MKFDTMNVVFSLVLLNQRKVPKEKAFATAAVAGIVGGPTGLLLPVIVASGKRPDGSFGSQLPSGPVTVAVPRVVGMPVHDASKAVTTAGLRPVTSIYYTAQNKPDEVVQQDPTAGTLVKKQTDVDLVVAQTPPEEELSESEKEDKILEVAQQTLAKVEELSSARKKELPK